MRRSRRIDFLSQINVTPLVDVMLVLLIIFMITAPMLQKGVEVKLPHVKKAPVIQLKEEPLIITVRRDGTLFLNSHAFSLEKLSVKLRALHKEVPKKKVLVRADGKVEYERVLKVLAAARQAGFVQVGLVTAPYKERKR